MNSPLVISPTPDATLRELADYLVAQAGAATTARGRFGLALSGGSSPRRLYELLAGPEYRGQVAWDRTYFFLGDERTVPLDAPESNYRMARETLLGPLGIPPTQVFAYDTRMPPPEAAAAYEARLGEFFGAEQWIFDLILLGLGDNSHTASLFPHTAVLQETAAGVRAGFVPELNTWRLTFTAPLINQARAVAFLVFGADKAAAVARVRTGPRDPAQYPAQLIQPHPGKLRWFLDATAAAKLPPA